MSVDQRFQLDPPRSILIVLPTWVGDFVMATPFLREVRHHFGSARITFVAEPNLREVIEGGEWMDDCLEWPAAGRRQPWHRAYRRLARELRSRSFDWGLLLPNSFRSALLAWSSRARRRIGYDRDGRGWLLTDRLAVKNRQNGQFVPMPLVEYYADLAQAIGCDRPGDRLELFTMPQCDGSVEERLMARGIAGHHPVVVLCPGGKFGSAKLWPAERYAALADRLIAQDGAAVIITFGPGEEAIVRKIQETMAEEATVFTDPPLGLGELKSLVRRCDLLLGNDTGPRHFAKAFDVPVVTVFGPTHTEWTATRYEAERIVKIDVDCGPCQQKTCPLGHLDCMTGVSVEAVHEACVALLCSDINRAVR